MPLMAGVSSARLGALLEAAPAESGGWEAVTLWPGRGGDKGENEKFLETARLVAESASRSGGARANGASAGEWMIGLRVPTEALEEDAPQMVLVFAGVGRGDEAEARLRLMMPLPLLYRLRRQAAHSETAVGHFAAVLDLVSALNAHQRFLPVAMTLCNEVATRHECARVSLGWMEHGYARVLAISHSEQFERKMEAVRRLEAVMEEALDQDEAVVWPEEGESSLITAAHEEYSSNAKAPYLCSVPLRLDGQPLAVLVCERASQAFSQVETRLLALYGEISVRRLAELKRTDRWFGARWLATVREEAGRFVGPKHSLAKLIGLLVLVTIPVLSLVKMDYRVDAPFTLRTDDVAYLSAPFNGFIDEAKVEVGDEVKKDDVLATLDTRDLLLEEAGAASDVTRFTIEIEKGIAADKPSEMRIAQAQLEQAKVRLALIQRRREQSAIKAPFDGILVEGDLRKKIGAPVKQGEMLIRVGRIQGTYVECEVNERDVRELQVGAHGEVAFASTPKIKFPIQITRIEPVALVKENGNSFIARGTVQAPMENWWRPGMSGAAKIVVARRPVLWVMLHRTIDFFRMHFWW